MIEDRQVYESYAECVSTIDGGAIEVGIGLSKHVSVGFERAICRECPE